MKKILAVLMLCFSCTTFAQSKFYATVFDEDNNPVARGFFKTASDSGIVLLVDKIEIFVLATEVGTLKIEKNPSKAEFIKLGTAVAGDAVGFLINKTEEQPASTNVPLGDSTLETSLTTSPDEASDAFSTETKEALYQRLELLIQNLLSGTNDIATFLIDNSSDKFISKLRLLQQYSMDKEIIALDDIAITGNASSNEALGASTEITNDSTKDQNKPGSVTLSKGFFFVKKSSDKKLQDDVKGQNVKNETNNDIVNTSTYPYSNKIETKSRPKPAVASKNQTNHTGKPSANKKIKSSSRLHTNP